MVEQYIVGDGEPPEWVRGYWEPYEKADKSVGYQLTIGRMVWHLEKGDVITRQEWGAKIEKPIDGFWRGW